MREVKALIRWYEHRKKNWLSAAEFTLSRYSGTLEFIEHLKSRRPYKYETREALERTERHASATRMVNEFKAASLATPGGKSEPT
jgi:hypothetical protein